MFYFKFIAVYIPLTVKDCPHQRIEGAVDIVEARLDLLVQISEKHIPLNKYISVRTGIFN